MPSQDDYLDSLLKDLNNEEAGGQTGEKEKTEDTAQIDMSDIEALLQSVSEETAKTDALARKDENSKTEETPAVDDLRNMSEDDIERLLNLGSGQDADEKKNQQEDVMNLLEESDDKDLQEIHDLLQKSDNHEEIADDSTASYQEEAPSEASGSDKKEERRAKKEARRAAREAKKAQKKAAKEAKRAGKPKEEENPEDFPEEQEIADMPDLDKLEAEASQEHKKGFFSRILDFLTEEDEEEEENEDIKLSQENKDILKEMDQEKRKGKKKDKKASRKAQNASGEGKEEEGSRKKKKAKKTPKKEKENLPLPEEARQPERRLPKKKVILVSLVCLSFGLTVIIIANVSGDYMNRMDGVEAYYSQDYMTCYQNLVGRNLNESEQVMLGKSESILRIRLWIREYELFVEEGLETEALDSLLQSVYAYPSLYEYAGQWNAQSEVTAEYAQILQILSEKYNLTQEQAQEIIAVPDDVEYTIIVTAISQGTDYEDWKNQQAREQAAKQEAQQLADQLPEETELSEEIFIDNIA